MIRSLLRRTGFMALSVFLVGLGAVLHAACEKVTSKGQAATQRPEDLKEVLARIDDVVITVGEFQDRINKQSPFVRARYTSLERKKEFLDNLVRFEVMAREAQRRGLDKDPEVIRTMKQALIQKLMRDEFESRIKPEDISDADAKTYFDAHLDEFNKPEEVRVAIVLLKDEKAAKKVLADPRIKGLDTADFRKLVAEYSIDTATKDRGGDLRYFDRNTKELPVPIVTAAFALTNLGDVSPPIKTSQGWNVLKLTGRRKALVRTFDEVKGQIKSRLFRDRRQAAMDAFIRDLRGKAQVEVHEDRLARVQIEAAGPGQFEGPGVPPPGPGMFHPPGQNAPQAGPFVPGTPPGASSISVPGQAPPPPPSIPPSAPASGEAH